MVDAVVRDLYMEPALQDMPPSTCLASGLADPNDGCYYATMYAPAFDVYSYVAIDKRDIALSRSNGVAFVEILERRLSQLRQRHYLACAAKRGGYY